MDRSDEIFFSESEVVRRAHLGDAIAWEAIIQLHQEPVFRFAYLLVRDPVEAEDIAQETFLRAYRSFASFDPQRTLRPWLLSITANLSRNRRRSLGRYMAALGRFFHADVHEPAGIEDLSARKEEDRVLWQAIRRLSETDRQVIYLRYFLELPVKDVAQVTGVASGTVKSRLHRSLKKLRIVLEQELPEYWKEWHNG
jgi:RNA polymerase sigma-70 factor (ECF subfamily)